MEKRSENHQFVLREISDFWNIVEGINFKRSADQVQLVSGAEVDASGATKKLGAGIVITGGGSMLRGLRQLFENCMGYETRIGVPNRLIKSNFESVTNMPSNSTSIGLLIMGFENTLNDGVADNIQFKIEEKNDTETSVTEEMDDTTANNVEEKPNKGKAFVKNISFST